MCASPPIAEGLHVGRVVRVPAPRGREGRGQDRYGGRTWHPQTVTSHISVASTRVARVSTILDWICGYMGVRMGGNERGVGERVWGV